MVSLLVVGGGVEVAAPPVSCGSSGARRRRALGVTVIQTVEVATPPCTVCVVAMSDVEVRQYVDLTVVYTVDQMVRVAYLVLVL